MGSTARFTVLVIAFAACGGGLRAPGAPGAPSTSDGLRAHSTSSAPAATAPTKAAESSSAPDPDLHRPPARKLLDIDWTKVVLTDDAAALALWRRIAPTGADWDDKLQEVPEDARRPLALAVLHGGNFLCTPPPTGDCAKPIYSVAPPADRADFDDPCLRRLLALWSIDQLEDDLPAIKDSLLAIAALPPPESQLVAAAIHAVSEADQDIRLAQLAAAWRAGQRELVADSIGALDEAHLIAAVRQHHIDAALEILSPEAHRAVYLAAVNDDALGTRARTAAITELVAADGKLGADLTAVLVIAAKVRNCGVAAAAARTLAQHGDHRFVPRRPRTANQAQLMRAMCVLASYEGLVPNDEPSLLPSYLPARGLERVTFTYDPLSEDGNLPGDPHVTRAAELVPRGEAVLPELEDLTRAMAHCTGAICVSEDHEFRFVWQAVRGELLLSRIELADRPPCTPSKSPKP